MTTNYYDTFISIAEDCAAQVGEIPPAKEPRTVADIQYQLLSQHPYAYTSDDVLYVSNGERRGISRDEFFSKGQPCFRSSPLVKRYGWGIHCNHDGKVAIYSCDSAEYKSLCKDQALKQLRGMRSKKG